MAETATTFDAFLKEWYSPGKIAELVYTGRPALEDVKKDGSGSGRRCIQPILFGNPQGLAADLANAQTAAQQAGNGGTQKSEDWIVPWGDYSAVMEITSKVLLQARDNLGAFMRAKKVNVDGILNAFGDTMSAYLFREGRNLCVFTISTGVCTVVTKQDLANIHVGMIINASADDGTSASHTLLGSGSAGFVFARNPNAGTFTVATSAANAAAGTAGTPGSWTGTMYAFRQGDFGGSGATAIFDGYGQWIPASDPSSTAFNGVNRTIDIQALSGSRLTGISAAVGVEQRVKRLVTAIAGVNGRKGPNVIYANPDKWQELADSLEARGYRMADGKDAAFNYGGIRVAMGGKFVDIKADPFCPYGTIFAINLDVVTMYSLDKFLHLVNGDGLEMLRKSNANTYEMRWESFPALVVAGPGECGRVAA